MDLSASVLLCNLSNYEKSPNVHEFVLTHGYLVLFKQSDKSE